MAEMSIKRGAVPSARHELAAAAPFAQLIGAPPNFIILPAKISMWGNDVHGDCVTAEEAFAKTCNNPEIFISDADVIAWATRHNVLEGANLVQVMQWMQGDGFAEGTNVYDDGAYMSVNWTNQSALQSAISTGPVKLGIAADQIDTAWHSTGGHSGWFAIGFHNDANEDHCVSLCGYGTLTWLAQQLNVAVPAGVDGNLSGYALFTWNTIGIIDHASMVAITHEAWLRRPTTVTKAQFPNWQMLDNNPATQAIAADGSELYQLHKTGLIWRYTGTPLTGWQQIDNNPATKKIVAAGGHLYQLHNTGKIWRYTGTPMTGWQLIDQNPATVDIVADGNDIYQLHNTGLIWKYTGTPITGWQMLDKNPATIKIVASGGHLYQLHNTGLIWRYTGPPVTGWQEIDKNPATLDIIADGNDLYQMHKTGLIWKYTGTPITGWQMLDNNPAGKQIAAANGRLFQRHDTGRLWKYVGPPVTGWQQLDNNPATISITASGSQFYQLHNDGEIWRYTGS
jgi:hypothetical protein